MEHVCSARSPAHDSESCTIILICAIKMSSQLYGDTCYISLPLHYLTLTDAGRVAGGCRPLQVIVARYDCSMTHHIHSN